METDYVVVELKYCEGCGGLYLRLPGQTGPYCPPCRERFASIALPPARREA